MLLFSFDFELRGNTVSLIFAFLFFFLFFDEPFLALFFYSRYVCDCGFALVCQLSFGPLGLATGTLETQLAILQILRVKRVFAVPHLHNFTCAATLHSAKDKRDQRTSFFGYQKPTSFEILTSLGTVEPRRFLRPQWSSFP